jgi:hypothetical protein
MTKVYGPYPLAARPNGLFSLTDHDSGDTKRCCHGSQTDDPDHEHRQMVDSIDLRRYAAPWRIAELGDPRSPQ